MTTDSEDLKQKWPTGALGPSTARCRLLKNFYAKTLIAELAEIGRAEKNFFAD